MSPCCGPRGSVPPRPRRRPTGTPRMTCLRDRRWGHAAPVGPRVVHCPALWTELAAGQARSSCKPRSRLVALAATAALTSETRAEKRDVGHQRLPQPQSHCPVELPTAPALRTHGPAHLLGQNVVCVSVNVPTEKEPLEVRDKVSFHVRDLT